MDIKSLTKPELLSLRDDIDKRLVEVEKEMRVAALEEMKAVAERHGVSMKEMAELANGNATLTGLAPKYRDPEDESRTWSGRGRKPKWLVQALAEGADLESFAISE
ncbi:MAG: H-NS family nucleoid-associated regulatory protein [Mangrovicoccus sp.]